MNICSDDQNTPLVAEQARGSNMLTQPDLRFCLFKLSDLGLFKSFPMFLLKRSFEITLELTSQHALQDIYTQEESKAAANQSIYLTLPGLTMSAAFQGINLYAGKCITRTILPDTKHLEMMKDQLLSNSLTLPYYTWTLSRVDKLSASNSIDASYSGS